MPRFEALLEEEGLFYLMTWEPKLKYVSRAAASRSSCRGPGRQGQPSDSEQLVPFDRSTPAGTEFELVLDDVTAAAAARRAGRGDRLQAGPLLRAARGHQLAGVRARRLAVHRGAGLPGAGPPGRGHPARSGNIEIGPDGVFADVEIPVPSLAFGVRRRDQPEVGLALDLPNSDPSKIGFNLSRREDPFCITVMGFGGTGLLRAGAGGRRHRLPARLDGRRVRAGGVDRRSSPPRCGRRWASSSLQADEGVTLGAYVELSANASVLGLVNLTGKVLLALQLQRSTPSCSRAAPRSAPRWTRCSASPRPAGPRPSRSPSARRPARPPCAPAPRRSALGGRALVRRPLHRSPQWTDYCLAFAAA